MHYSRSEIEELGIEQLSQVQIEEAFEAFNGFAEIFGRAWIEAYFGSSNSPLLVSNIVSLWEDWSAVKELEGASKLLDRWKQGVYEQGVSAELRVVAHFSRVGVEVELFPQVGSRVCDFRFRLADDWVYAEVSRRGVSEVLRRRSDILEKVAQASANAVDGMHGKTAILRDLDEEEVEHLLSWLSTSRSQGRATRDDLAVFIADSIDSGTNDIDQLVSEPRLYCTRGIINNHRIVQRGTACLSMSDEAIQEAFKTEVSQLPRDQPAMVFLDVSGVVGGYKACCSTIQRRLQPNINTRVSAVTLYQVASGGDGPEINGALLLNQYARNPLSESEIGLVRSFVGS
jgi:hypothetical protein